MYLYDNSHIVACYATETRAALDLLYQTTWKLEISRRFRRVHESLDFIRVAL